MAYTISDRSHIVDDSGNYIGVMSSESSSGDEDMEHFVLPTQSRRAMDLGHKSRRGMFQPSSNSLSTFCSFQAFVTVLFALISLSAVIALAGYAYYIHAQLISIRTVCARLSDDASRKTETGEFAVSSAFKDLVSNTSELQEQLQSVLSVYTSDIDNIELLRSMPQRFHSMSQKLSTLDSSVQNVEADVLQFIDDRDNIRAAFNDLTFKLIKTQDLTHGLHNQLSSLLSRVSTVENLLSTGNNASAPTNSSDNHSDDFEFTLSSESSDVGEMQTVLNAITASLSSLIYQVNNDTLDMRQILSGLSHRVSAIERIGNVNDRMTRMEQQMSRLLNGLKLANYTVLPTGGQTRPISRVHTNVSHHRSRRP